MKIRTWAEQKELEKQYVEQSRREWLEGLAGQFETQKEMAKALGLEPNNLFHLAKRAGLKLPNKMEGRRPVPPRPKPPAPRPAEKPASKPKTMAELARIENARMRARGIK